MCLTLQPAKLSNTTLYAGEANLDGRYVHVIGYQNKAQNQHAGPNAMILPFPSRAPMGPENVFDTTGCKRVLTDLGRVIPRADRLRGFSKGIALNSVDSLSVQVFDTGSYTVLMSKNIAAIPSALNQVPANKRPQINQDIFDAYAKWYQGWSIALCCFEAGAEVKPEPMVWWYEPINEEWLFAPGLDGHDGRVPRLDKGVDVYTDIVFGSTIEPAGTPVRYTDAFAGGLAQCLPSRACGAEVHGVKVNGDYLIQREMVRNGNANYKRLAPPGART
jgi:hypothetical protein